MTILPDYPLVYEGVPHEGCYCIDGTDEDREDSCEGPFVLKSAYDELLALVHELAGPELIG